MNYKPPLELIHHTASTSNINASIIWLHGLGADGYDFEPIAQRLLQIHAFAKVRFILPHAPAIAVTRNNGYVMPAWYDIYGDIPVKIEDQSGIHTSQQYIDTLIEHEIDRGITSDRIILAGFSQGGAIALHTALRYPKTLAGILALSTYLPLQTMLAQEASSANKNTPIFMAHGQFDDIIPYEMANASRHLLQNCQYPVMWHPYQMAHSLCEEEITDIQHFLQQVLRLDLVE